VTDIADDRYAPHVSRVDLEDLPPCDLKCNLLLPDMQSCFVCIRCPVFDCLGGEIREVRTLIERIKAIDGMVDYLALSKTSPEAMRKPSFLRP
jgi:hypothetical protein